jgi:branched-chain amino acid transport system ATP-binding protein
MKTGEPILSVESLAVSYDRISAVRDVSFSVGEGELVALIGSNGAGKSTILRAISGLIPSSGTIRFRGQPLAGTPANRRTAMGIAHVPEGRGILGNLTVLENLVLASWTRRDRAGVPASLEKVFALFPRLRERRKQSAGTLSGGEQQMLAIGRALMIKGDLMLLDEPSMGLAPMLVREIFRVLSEINRAGTAVLLVEQNARLALKTATRADVLETGRIVIEGEGPKLLNDPRVKEAYLGA